LILKVTGLENIDTKLSPKAYIILVNYNGWIDTIECLESVLKLAYQNFQVIVVDNNSPNNSLEYIQQWAEGERKPIPSEHTIIYSLVYPLIPKPVSYKIYGKNEAEEAAGSTTSLPKVIFIQAGENGGFAAGNNVGIDFALKRGDADYVWLLNNDTVVDRKALSYLIEHFEDSPIKLGILGSKLLYYHNPSIIQAIAGRYNPWLSTTGHIGGNVTDTGQYDSHHVPSADYIVGASMFISKQFLLDVGNMQEDYFLYFEELDWS
jgi:GT2 family glycosyltransferase